MRGAIHQCNTDEKQELVIEKQKYAANQLATNPYRPTPFLRISPPAIAAPLAAAGIASSPILFSLLISAPFVCISRLEIAAPLAAAARPRLLAVPCLSAHLAALPVRPHRRPSQIAAVGPSPSLLCNHDESDDIHAVLIPAN
uniref:Uncharacterized protein n=1 Tax=Setaria viridis TaxID=4556 RepID=A0A4U6TE14_SETVI|nr:hypothetical protein SEVIR_8G106400v2 [Setaria viridis]